MLTSRPTEPAGPSHAPAYPARRPTMVALVAIVGLVLVSVALSRPPGPVPASADSAEFSAERAMEQLRAISPDHPTPVGSEAGDDVRDYLTGQLNALRLDVQVQTGLGALTNGNQTAAGRVDNVVAQLPGTDSTGRVILSAHYDTTFGSPGAADDKAAVAAVLETVRAVTDGSSLRNDILVVLTDGEEHGMLGADAFVDANPPGATDVVLNFEAPGNKGPSVLFETSAGNAGLIGAFQQWVPHPVGDSAMAALYESSGQHTDFTVLKAAGYRGLNFALIDGTAFDHHSQDTVDNLDPAQATIRAPGHRTVTATPTYPSDSADDSWPYELRFYDPPDDRIQVTLQLEGPKLPSVFVSDYTVGRDGIPGLFPRPPHLGRSADHSAELVVVSKDHRLMPNPSQE